MSISRVLIANRGEIAVRIIRACSDLKIGSVLAASEADMESLPSKMADRVVCIGPAKSSDSYLKVESIISAALGTGCNGIHPGYGFLAEEPRLAEACNKNGLKFIGPPAEKIRSMGNKLLAREGVSKFGIPVVPGSKKVGTFQEASDTTEEMGYPVLLKASAGGGGRGMKVALNRSELQKGFETASAEARASFGDATLYLERYIPNARHIEVQVLGDQFGNVIHLGERDCSLQRRYQKVLEEAPASSITEALRDEIHKAAVTIAKEMHYENAGTVEFILDRDSQQFYFLEMNTRIQVEHPVTEMITGVDLVQEQISIANGRPLSYAQSDIKFTGHAIECRINAESPSDGFRPCPGSISEWSPPDGAGIRVDSHCFPGYLVPPFYDSLLAKLILRGEDRAVTIQRTRQALENFKVKGIDTTIPFLNFLLGQRNYVEGDVNTRWLEERLEKFSL